ncbi:protein phosphatase type 2C [Hanseniaspora valbyensis NRRL Y-1626]|uniref:Protein phosphatase type 2C n=1 Tax=Hanseniaspora valbyensis NRRL Y-1626 TaxID=766949 RepID=A0A1B7T9T5_9ASCO|nr:protein phosphatase type 2C [Hanseniaspora valbyensis NRRL Y-1626]
MTTIPPSTPAVERSNQENILNGNDIDDELTYNVGISSNKNSKYRKKMEDIHTFVENFNNKLDWGYFAIFDGHAGIEASKWCGKNLHDVIENKMNADNNRDIREIFNESFQEADKEINANLSGHSGCTAAVCILRWEQQDDSDDGLDHSRMLYTANVGDSRIVLMRDSVALRLTYDHKASDAMECKRVESIGGLVIKNRVNGMLAVTRSIGDKFFDSLVISNPFTTKIELTSKDEFMIIACDGLWDVMEDQEACDFIVENELTTDPQMASELLIEHALKLGSADNLTVMVVSFKTYEP